MPCGWGEIRGGDKGSWRSQSSFAVLAIQGNQYTDYALVLPKNAVFQSQNIMCIVTAKPEYVVIQSLCMQAAGVSLYQSSPGDFISKVFTFKHSGTRYTL